MDAAVAGLVGALGGAGITAALTIYRDHRDSKEQYKAMLYEKRLDIYQQAFRLIYEFCMSIPESINELSKERMDEIVATNKKLINFWTLHCFYLDPESLKAIASLSEKFKTIYDIFNCSLEKPLTQEEANKYNEWHVECQELVNKVIVALEKGIGMKHIEQLKGLSHV